jgi:hypothetical protein
MRVRGFIVASAVLFVLGTAACGESTPSVVDSPSSAPRTSTTTATVMTTDMPTTVTSGRATTTKPNSGAPVGAASFRADLTIQSAGLGLLALTNTTRGPITVQGWPTLVFLNAANETLAVPTKKVDVPGAGPSIDIGTGETAFAGVRWVTGDKADPKTHVAMSIRLTLPRFGGSINVNIIGAGGQSGGDIEFDLTSVQIGTLQPSSQGVLVF